MTWWYTKKTQFSSTVFNILSQGVIHFVASDSSKNTFWLVVILWQPIRSFYSMVLEANTRNKTEHTMWKGSENCAIKWCLFLCTVLFEVTCAFSKMWRVLHLIWVWLGGVYGWPDPVHFRRPVFHTLNDDRGVLPAQPAEKCRNAHPLNVGVGPPLSDDLYLRRGT